MPSLTCCETLWQTEPLLYSPEVPVHFVLLSVTWCLRLLHCRCVNGDWQLVLDWNYIYIYITIKFFKAFIDQIISESYSLCYSVLIK